MAACMYDTFKILEETIKEKCAGKPAYYFPNPGNLGDAIIREATIRFFKKINLEYKEMKKVGGLLHQITRPRDGIFIYGGGGAWCELWDHSRDVAKLAKNSEVIVLPSTYDKLYSIPNVTFFCRDSFESKQNMQDAIFCHDMAFSLGRLRHQPDAQEDIGFFFRTDKESANAAKIPPNNIDISATGNHLSDTSVFVDAIARFTQIHTDRLHVAIIATLLDRETHLYPGRYFKNKAIYLSSMKDRFDNIHFHGDVIGE
jgi:exopolysaccharide biosynthesis predicted pyruvyltransferase EpsI